MDPELVGIENRIFNPEDRVRLSEDPPKDNHVRTVSSKAVLQARVLLCRAPLGQERQTTLYLPSPNGWPGLQPRPTLQVTEPVW